MVIAFCIFVVFIIGFLVNKRNIRNIHERIPAMMMVKVHDKDDQLSALVDEDEKFVFS